MTLPSDFQFSQANLQDYVDCRRRFQLRHLLQLAWPAIQAEPAEEHENHSLQGELFHRLVHQHQLGIPPERLTRLAQAAKGTWQADREEGDNRLAVWWDNYLRSPVSLTGGAPAPLAGQASPAGLPRQRHPEVTLSAPMAGHRLLAKLDLVALEPASRVVIVDWKTSRTRPGRPWLAARLQTRVYRYIVVEAGARGYSGAALNEARSWRPDQVEMVYWFANYPDQPERLQYGEREYLADREYLSALTAEISHAGEDEFFLTEDTRRCRLCSYRSLCNRGIEAGSAAPAADSPDEASEIEEAPASWESGFDFEQVAEIAY
jgi:CRISPR/Cas system-associated exonuclease Cas4 (RecB family)